MSPLNCLFVVQGEGRGHMTQALALKAILEDAGHRVTAVLMGKSSGRRVPAFFLEKIGAPVTYFDSPNFALDATQKSVDMGATIVQNVRLGSAFRASIDTIHTAIEATRPDVIINFFEPLFGAYVLLHRPAAPVVCIGHQYMYHHPVYPFPSGMWAQRFGAKNFTRVSSFGASRLLALSYYPAPSRPRLSVLPPLLRPEVFEQPLDAPIEEPFYLMYLLNQGYADEVIAWHREHPERRLHCFWDNPQVPEAWDYSPTLTFHPLSDRKFLEMMARCSGLICTAGFESTCEAMYFGKTILAVPVRGHAEQYWNALDLAGFGGGVYAPSFEIERLEEASKVLLPPTHIFRAWVDQAPDRFIREIEEVVTTKNLSIR